MFKENMSDLIGKSSVKTFMNIKNRTNKATTITNKTMILCKCLH